MNERIRELAEQARKYFSKTESSGEYWVFDEDKFAELIVRECAEFTDPVTRNLMMKHFGVEE